MIDSSFLKVPMPRKPVNMNSYQLLHTVRFRWEFGATEDPLAGSRPTMQAKSVDSGIQVWDHGFGRSSHMGRSRAMESPECSSAAATAI